MTPENLASHLRATCAFMLSGAGVSVPCGKTHCLLHEAARVLEEQTAKASLPCGHPAGCLVVVERDSSGFELHRMGCGWCHAVEKLMDRLIELGEREK